ncbi:MAG: DNA alkylation repair protein [Erysipelotrichaceae bacterium]|nr:DNA alkylation repair protein [Erysipelotrichaceae bacterium]
MNKYSEIKKRFETNADEQNALLMSRYMRNRFLFYGIASPERKALYKEFINTEKKKKTPDWEFLDQCYEDEHREFQYLVFDYLLALRKYVSFEDIPRIRTYILTKSWWDTIDFLCKVIGDIGLRDARVKEQMIEWSKDENIWIRRTAIEHQLGLKEKTDPELLEKIIVNCLGSDEFFLNKAIGWALRDYSKTDPEWVRSFMDRYADQMNALSIREAGKYISF